MVTKQQQLEWLVNKADVWGDDRTIGYMMSRDEAGFVVGLFTRMSSIDLLTGHFHIITRQEWQQERDKMQKRGAINDMTPVAMPISVGKHVNAHDLQKVIIQNYASATIAATHTGDGEITITAQDSSWHERGEFPPAGCECEAFADGCEPEVCTILATHNGTAAVKWSKFNNGGLDVITLNGWSFRPIRTEREMAIDALVEIICAGGELSKDGSAAREIAERIYDAQKTKEQAK